MWKNLLAIAFVLGSPAFTAESWPGHEGHARTLSISFVFDTTASMGDVLLQMRKSAAKILERIESAEMVQVRFNYVLVLFNDPDIEDVFVTTDKGEFLRKLWDIYVHDGGDCPEKSLNALSEAIESSSLDAHIFLFTDADSKEREVDQRLNELIRVKSPKLYFVITGKCYRDYDPVYQQLAQATKGHLFIVHENEVTTLLDKFAANLLDYQSANDVTAPANLVQVAPHASINLTIDHTPDVIYEYDEFTLRCSAIGGSTTNLGLTLIRDNVPVADKICTTISYNSKQVVAFTVAKARSSDAGVYVCKARQPGAEQSARQAVELAVTGSYGLIHD